MTELQRAIWLLSTPATAEINRAMQQFTGAKYETSDQHKDVASTRLERDHDDAKKITEFLIEHDPFDMGTDLVNICGEVANSDVNAHKAHSIGETIIKNIEGTPVFSYSFKRKDMAFTMKSNSSIALGDITVQVDPQLFFQRLIIFIKPEDIKDAFLYELSIWPTSLFDKDGLMNKADKPELKNALAKLPGIAECVSAETPREAHYVIRWCIFAAKDTLDRWENLC